MYHVSACQVYARGVVSTKRVLAISVAVVLLVYCALQVWVAMDPPIRWSGNGVMKAESGRDVVLDIYLRNRHHLPGFSFTDVSIDPAIFRLRSACVIRHNMNPGFTGVAALELPPEFA